MPKPHLDVLDLKILKTLQEEGRLSNVELADRVYQRLLIRLASERSLRGM